VGSLPGAALKGFYYAADARLPAPVRERSTAEIVSSVFYSFPAEILATWCCVSVETAARWKRGESKPSPQALKLFELHRDRKVLGASDWDGWLVQGNRLVDPEGNETTQGQLRAYFFVYQLCRELARRDETALEHFEKLLRIAG
jgi:hypothetical protein